MLLGDGLIDHHDLDVEIEIDWKQIIIENY